MLRGFVLVFLVFKLEMLRTACFANQLDLRHVNHRGIDCFLDALENYSLDLREEHVEACRRPGRWYETCTGGGVAVCLKTSHGGVPDCWESTCAP